jgi:ATP-dependent protease ClpP protease subunit
MTQDDKTPMFSWRMREQLLGRRILVLDGPLDDDNGTLLMTQLLTLAAEDPDGAVSLWIHSPGGSVPAMLAIRDTTAEQARDYGFIDHIVNSFNQVIPERQRVGINS